MATLFSEPFTYSNGSILSVASTNWTDVNSQFSIVGNQLSQTAGGGYKAMITKVAAHAATADVRVSVVMLTGATADGGPVARMTADTDGYALDMDQSAGTLFLTRRVASADTQLATRSVTHAANNKYSLEVSGTGATVTLKMFVNDVQQGADVLDTSGSRITAAGRTGLHGFATQTFDDFLVEDAAGGGGGGPALTGPLLYSRPNVLVRL